jgi:predicted methyltransferase MtxX (methanogen marker protein 4)
LRSTAELAPGLPARRGRFVGIDPESFHPAGLTAQMRLASLGATWNRRKAIVAKIAVVTGSNGRIGQASCRRLARAGFVAVGVDVGATGAGNWPHY